ncbi:hypothetical protein CRUP_022150 [Coryphaenoides rupestris]|nr:hypothetical protein CRUP_022150 [Coryphaenoides rupestris]
MDSLETPYEIEVPIDFIDCTVCHKSIRSETLYKIHLTTIGHIKKEDALVASGLAIRTEEIPCFEDIVQYLQYLNLDEPIIGLSYLQLVRDLDPNDSQDPSPRYFCQLCVQEANLPNMMNHVIGRKHRQKYLMAERKDLVTWDSSTVFNEAAKVIRAKAEVVERQDGCGTPKPMKQNKGKSNITRVLPNQRRMQYSNGPQEEYPGPVHHPGDYSHHEGHPPPFHPDDNYLEPEEEEREHYQRRGPHHSPQQDGYMENDHGRQHLMEPHYDRGYPEDPMGGGYRDRPFPQAEHSPMRGFGEQMPRREEYEQEASPYRRPHPENDPLKQFYSEELRRERARANEAAAAAATDGRNYLSRDAIAYPPEGPQRQHPGGHPHGSRYPPEAPGGGPVDYPYENDRFDDEIRQRAPAPEESYAVEEDHRMGYHEAQRRAYPGGRASHPSHPDQARHDDPDPRGNTGQPFDRGYLSEMAGASHHKMAGPRNAVDSSYQMMPEGGRGMSGIPEPFRRFLQGDTSSQDVRKRKSRFSDATQEEMEGSKRMLMGLDGRSMFEGSGPLRHEAHGSQRPDPFSKMQSQYQPEHFENAREGGKVFDILENLEIENGEEAAFLKSQLCNLLKDFQAKKLGNALQSRADSAPISRDYHHGSAPPRGPSPPPHRAEPRREAFREGMAWRPTESHPRQTEPHPWPTESHPRPSQDPRGWEEEQRGGPPAAERFQEHRRPVHQDSNVSSRQRYEEVFGGGAQHRAPPQAPPTEDRYQDPGGPYDYTPAASYDYTPADPEFFGGRSASPPHRRDQGYRRHGGLLPRTSNLDKITSTLLELVARK